LHFNVLTIRYFSFQGIYRYLRLYMDHIGIKLFSAIFDIFSFPKLMVMVCISLSYYSYHHHLSWFRHHGTHLSYTQPWSLCLVYNNAHYAYKNLLLTYGMESTGGGVSSMFPLSITSSSFKFEISHTVEPNNLVLESSSTKCTFIHLVFEVLCSVFSGVFFISI